MNSIIRVIIRSVLYLSFFTILLINVSGLPFNLENNLNKTPGASISKYPGWEIPVITNAPIHDQAIPGCTGGWIAMHAKAGIHKGDFHISFEKDEKGFYTYFNGSSWETPLKLFPTIMETTGRRFV